MSHIRAAALAFAALSVAASGAWVAPPARAQIAPGPSPYSTGYDVRRERFKRELTALTAEARESVGKADANIAALEEKVRSSGEPERTQYRNLADKLSMLKGRVTTDIDKMGTVAFEAWGNLRPVVQRDVAALDGQLKNASTIAHIPAAPEDR
jgi:hypothetical protein